MGNWILRRRGRRGGLANAIKFLRQNADIYIDADSTIAGSDSDVTGVTADGALGLSFSQIGTGANITRDASGLTFAGGKYLRWDDTGGDYDGALILFDATVNGTPAATATFVNLENDTASRQMIRLTTGHVVQVLGPNSAAQNIYSYGADGQRGTVGFIVDPEQNALTGTDKQAIIGTDGYLSGDPGNSPGTDIGLNRIDIGTAAPITLHRLVVFLIPSGGSLPDTVYNLWAKVAGVTPRLYSTSDIEIIPVNGQSQPIGPSITTAQEGDYNYLDRNGVKMVAGLKRSDAATIALVGPQQLGYDLLTPATGIQPAAVDNNLNTGLIFGVALNRLRASGSRPLLTAFNGISGKEIEEFDDDPLTGTSSVLIAENVEYWSAQAASAAALAGYTPTIPLEIFDQGEAGKDKAAGEWAAFMDDVRATYLSYYQAAVAGAVPIPLIIQVAGDYNTVGESWAVRGDHVTWAIANGGIVVPAYPFEIQVADGVHRTIAGQIGLAETAAWAYHLGASAWNIPFPAASVDGSVLTLTYSLPTGRSLQTAADYYSGVGISDYGYEVDGANITGVVVDGSTVTITCDAPPTAFRYCAQEQDVSSSGDGLVAHRGLMRTDLSSTGKLSGNTIYQWLPGQPTTSV